MAVATRKEQRQRRHLRIRKKISGTSTVPRVTVFVSGKHLYVQLIDDESQQTLVGMSTLDAKLREQQVRANIKGAQIVGAVVAERAVAAGIRKAVFDRGGFKYHGRIKMIADQLRAAGLEL